MDRKWSKGLNDPFGWCDDLAEAHLAVSERVAMLMNMAVPTPAAVREMKERIAREDEEAHRETTARTVAVVAKLKASHEASGLVAGETA